MRYSIKSTRSGPVSAGVCTGAVVLLLCLGIQRSTAQQCGNVRRRVDCGSLNVTASLCAARGCCWEPMPEQPSCFFDSDGAPIQKVHLIQTNHFDAGFTNVSLDVLELYWYHHFPLALDIAANLSKADSPSAASFRYMAQAYVVGLFFDCPPDYGLKCPNASMKARVEKGIRDGVIYMHAFPMNGQNELAYSWHIEAAVNYSRQLTQQFGIDPPISFSQRDVPGLIRAELPALARAGVRFISEGSNAANIPPNVPPLFWWTDGPSDTTMLTAFHAYGYGTLSKHAVGPSPPESLGALDFPPPQEDWVRDYVRAPGFGEIMVYNWKVDNSGPPANSSVVEATFQQLEKMFPGATIEASTIDSFATNLIAFLEQGNNSRLIPKMDREMGDSWLYGGASDPLKIMRYRSAARLAGSCVENGGCSLQQPAFANFSRLLVKAFEHTFGSSGNLAGKYKWANLTNAEYHQIIADGGTGYAPFAALVRSWNVQRDISVNFPLTALSEGTEGTEGKPSDAMALQLQPSEPAEASTGPASPGALRAAIEADWQAQLDAAQPPQDPAAQGFSKLQEPTQPIPSLGGWLTLAFSSKNSAAMVARDERSGEAWASASNPLGLYEYQQLAESDFLAFEAGYCAVRGQRCFDPGHFWNLKPPPSPVLAAPELVEVWVRNGTGGGSAAVLVRGTFANASNATLQRLHSEVGAPQEVWVRYDLGSSPGQVAVTLTAVNKTSTRFPEAQWLSFNPPQDTSAAAGSRNPWPHRAPWIAHTAEEAVALRNQARDARRRLRSGEDPAAVWGRAGRGQRSRPATNLPKQLLAGAESPHHAHGRRLHAAHSSHAEGQMESHLPGLLLQAAGWLEEDAARAAAAPGGSRWDPLRVTSGITPAVAANVSVEPWRFPFEDAVAAARARCDDLRRGAHSSHAPGRGLHGHGHGHERGEHSHHRIEFRYEHGHVTGPCELVQRLTGARPFLVEDHSSHAGWELNKLGEWMDPSDYVADAARALAGVGEGVRYTPLRSSGANATLTVGFLDAAIVRWGNPAPFPTPMQGPTDYTRGAQALLQTNAYPVNFPLVYPWYDSVEVPSGSQGAARWQGNVGFRFQLQMQ